MPTRTCSCIATCYGIISLRILDHSRVIYSYRPPLMCDCIFGHEFLLGDIYQVKNVRFRNFSYQQNPTECSFHNSLVIVVNKLNPNSLVSKVLSLLDSFCKVQTLSNCANCEDLQPSHLLMTKFIPVSVFCATTILALSYFFKSASPTSRNCGNVFQHVFNWQLPEIP